MNAGRLLTVREVAAYFGVAPDTVLRWTSRGALPAIRMPSGALRYSEQALDEWIAGRSTVSSTQPGARE